MEAESSPVIQEQLRKPAFQRITQLKQKSKSFYQEAEKV